MNHADPATIRNIHEAGLKEFVSKGFQNASLRNIVKEAGVTTGAFYGYYKSKGELFDVMAGYAAQELKEIFAYETPLIPGMDKKQAIQSFREDEVKRMTRLTRYSFDNQDAIRMLVCGATGTQYENLWHELTEISTIHTMNLMEELDYHPVTSEFVHILISGMFKSFCELIEHDITRCEAGSAMKILGDFYIAGWTKILNLTEET